MDFRDFLVEGGEGRRLSKPQRKRLIDQIDANAEYAVESNTAKPMKGSYIIATLKEDEVAAKPWFDKYVAFYNGMSVVIRLGHAHGHKKFNQGSVDIPVDLEWAKTNKIKYD